jgi:hypothetical protein
MKPNILPLALGSFFSSGLGQPYNTLKCTSELFPYLPLGISRTSIIYFLQQRTKLKSNPLIIMQRLERITCMSVVIVIGYTRDEKI